MSKIIFINLPVTDLKKSMDRRAAHEAGSGRHRATIKHARGRGSCGHGQAPAFTLFSNL